MTPATGNVLKMLVGAVIKKFDDDEERSDHPTSADSSPPQRSTEHWRAQTDERAMRQFEDAMHPRE